MRSAATTTIHKRLIEQVNDISLSIQPTIVTMICIIMCIYILISMPYHFSCFVVIFCTYSLCI